VPLNCSYIKKKNNNIYVYRYYLRFACKQIEAHHGMDKLLHYKVTVVHRRLDSCIPIYFLMYCACQSLVVTEYRPESKHFFDAVKRITHFAVN